MEQNKGVNIKVLLPKNYIKEESYPLLLINDGSVLEKFDFSPYNFIVCLLSSNNRLDDFSPYFLKAINPRFNDFGGKCKEYNNFIFNEVLQGFLEKYKVSKVIYGGISLGGLASIDSIFDFDNIDFVFSICGSFWYPNLLNYYKEKAILNKNLNLYLLNGKKEGDIHKKENVFNPLSLAYINAQEVHKYFKEINKKTISIFDEYAHHDHIFDRLKVILDLVLKDINF